MWIACPEVGNRLIERQVLSGEAKGDVLDFFDADRLDYSLARRLSTSP